MGHRTQSEHYDQSEPLRSSTKICIALVFEQFIDFYFIHWRYRPQWTRIAYIYLMSTERTQSIRTIWENIQYYRPRKYHTVHLVPEATSNFLKFNLLSAYALIFNWSYLIMKYSQNSRWHVTRIELYDCWSVRTTSIYHKILLQHFFAMLRPDKLENYIIM